MRKLCIPKYLHPSLTGGQTGAGQTGLETDQTGLKHSIRVRSCVFTRVLLEFELLMVTYLPTLYI